MLIRLIRCSQMAMAMVVAMVASAGLVKFVIGTTASVTTTLQIAGLILFIDNMGVSSTRTNANTNNNSSSSSTKNNKNKGEGTYRKMSRKRALFPIQRGR